MTLTIESHMRGATESLEAAELLLSKGFTGIAALVPTTPCSTWQKRFC
jgi:hypothetical protein